MGSNLYVEKFGSYVQKGQKPTEGGQVFMCKEEWTKRLAWLGLGGGQLPEGGGCSQQKEAA